MNFKALIISTSILSCLISGCTFQRLTSALDAQKKIDENNKKATDEIEKELQESQKKTDDLLAKMKKDMEAGGQPGSIELSGAVIKGDSSIDDRITMYTEGGKGKDGTKVPVIINKHSAISEKDKKINLSKLTEDKTLIAVGCDEKLVHGYAQEKSLEVKQLPPYENKKDNITYIVTANTIILCEIKEFERDFISLISDELILSNFQFSHYSAFGGLTINTNKLLLLGKNQIAARAADSSMTILPGPDIFLNVEKEVSSGQDGKLLLATYGSNYKEDKK
ncbi:MAG: hypothetical protein ACXVCY_04025 [Pseudobdellovibrionaceae bacterium]